MERSDERQNSSEVWRSIYTVNLVVASLDRTASDGKSIGYNSVWGQCDGTRHPKLPLPHADGSDGLHDAMFQFSQFVSGTAERRQVAFALPN